MANKCAICGADINLIQTQRLADGNCICRKTCVKKGLRAYDYVHSDLHGVAAHIKQVEQGTKLWNHYFVPREKTKDKSQKLQRFGYDLYIAEDLGLMAFTQDDYKFFIFGKTTHACVYRIADLRSYEYETETVKNGDKEEKKLYIRLGFADVEGLYEVLLPIQNAREFEDLKKYFDKLFGIQKTLGNAANTWKQQMTAIKDVTAGFRAAVKGEADEEKAAKAVNSLDAAIYGDRTEWIKKADAALAAFNG